MEAHPISNFFNDGCVLVTGATGFVGKALVEKLLRCCPGLSTVYLLVRPKVGADVATRHARLLQHHVFDRIRRECPGVLGKVVSMRGDVALPGLWLEEADRMELCTRVCVVFHAAATVKFNETLRVAVNLNTAGTLRVLQLCHRMDKLQAFVHVSTAYSNLDRGEVKEVVYPPPAEPESVIHCCEAFSDDVLDQIAEKLQGKHPNTYTMTKAMAEWLVLHQAEGVPAAIVRPSIVTAAWHEPTPGWLDNMGGITNVVTEMGRGTARTLLGDTSLVVDIIPVDVVVNALMAVAWHTATFRSREVRVYNCTTSTIRPITWGHLSNLIQKHSCRHPSTQTLLYPGFSYTTSRTLFGLLELILHMLPAFVMDLLRRTVGAQPIMLKLAYRLHKSVKYGNYFTMHEWKFHSENLQTLATALPSQDDGDIIFNTDVSLIDWDRYIEHYMLGIRRHILHDPDETLPTARSRLKRLYWIDRTARVLAAVATLHVIYSKFLRKGANFRRLFTCIQPT